jgi:hypothetical protein
LQRPPETRAAQTLNRVGGSDERRANVAAYAEKCYGSARRGAPARGPAAVPVWPLTRR